jgi:hypothetical protein
LNTLPRQLLWWAAAPAPRLLLLVLLVVLVVVLLNLADAPAAPAAKDIHLNSCYGGPAGCWLLLLECSGGAAEHMPTSAGCY